MSSTPNFSEEGARAGAAAGAFTDGPDHAPLGRESPKRSKSHGRANPIVHHKGQEQEIHGGRTAARQQATTDSSRGRGRAATKLDGMSPWAKEVLYVDTNYGTLGANQHADTVAAQLDPRRAEPLPPDHPEVVKEIKFDRISRLMQPGTDDEVEQQLGLDSDDDWIS